MYVNSDEEFEKAQKTFQSGKKNLFLNKYDESVNNIGEACKIYSAKFGELDPQCAEVYFFYGRALLELARVENTVLGNALNGVPEDTSPIDDSRYGNPEEIPADEKKKISEEVIDALCNEDATATTTTTDAEMTSTTTTTTTTSTTNGEETKAEATTAAAAVTEAESKPVEMTSSEEKPAETATATTTTATTTEEKTATAEEKKEAEGEEGAEEDDEEDEEDEGEDATNEEECAKSDEKAKDDAEAEEISNLQRSWEMFELAKLIYTKNFESDATLKNKRVAECLLKLGEISVEQEIYDQAITDISESIRLQEAAASQSSEQRDERMLAESYYQLGLSQQFANMFAEANDSYQKSINIMQLRIEKLKAKWEAMSADADVEPERNTIKDEIADLEALLPEMLAKLEEVNNEQGQQSLNLIKEAKECFTNSSVAEATAAASVNGADVKDITSLVKSKRKIGETGEEDSTIKKTRLSESNEAAPAAAATSETVEAAAPAVTEAAAPVAAVESTTVEAAAAAAPATAEPVAQETTPLV